MSSDRTVIMRRAGIVERSPVSTTVLGKAFEVLDVFKPAGRLLTVSEVSRKSGLAKSTAHRVLAMLCEIGAVEREHDSYRIGLRMLSIGSQAPEVAVRHMAMPFLLELHRSVGHTVHLCALRGLQVVYLEKLQAPGSVRFGTEVGMVLPAHCTGAGKALLAASGAEFVEALLARPLESLTARSIGDASALAAELNMVRARGFATDLGEAKVGLSCVARSISIGSRPVAAVSVSFPDGAYRAEFRHALAQSVARIERALKGSEGPAGLPPAFRSYVRRA